MGGDKINDNFTEIYTLLGTGTALTSGLSATSSVVTLVSVHLLQALRHLQMVVHLLHQLQTRVIQILVYSLVQQMKLRSPQVERKDLKSLLVVSKLQTVVILVLHQTQMLCRSPLEVLWHLVLQFTSKERCNLCRFYRIL